jgi:hypothetical protein
MQFKECIKKKKLSISPALATKAIAHLYKNNKQLVEDAIKEVEKPKPYFDYIYLFPRMLTRFCELKGYPESHIIGVDIGQQRKWEQTIFIAVLAKTVQRGGI